MDDGTEGDAIFFQRADTCVTLLATREVNTHHFAIVPSSITFSY
jgi:hypothetical protein